MFQLRPWVTEVGGKGRQAATADTLRSSSAGRAPGRFGPLRTASHRFAAEAAEAGDRSTCESLWARLPSLGLEPQDSEQLGTNGRAAGGC